MLFNKLALMLLSLIVVAAALPSPPSANVDKRSADGTLIDDVSALADDILGNGEIADVRRL